MASNIKFMLPWLRRILHGAADVQGDEKEAIAFEARFCNATLATWEALAPPVTDNYSVR
mgnify:CR=1 FL=1